MEKTSPLHAPLSVASHALVAPDRLRLRTEAPQLCFDPNERAVSSQFSYHQPRAEKALTLGIRMRNAGHIFLCGPTGTARRAIIEAALRQHGRPLTELRDYVAANPLNPESQRPVCLSLAAGQGRAFLESADKSIRDCQDRIRRLALDRARRSAPDLEDAEREAWIQETDDWRATRSGQVQRTGFDPIARDYLAALHEALAERWRIGIDVAAIQGNGTGAGTGFERLLDEAERLSDYRPLLIREAPRGQVPIVFEPNPTFSNLFGSVWRETGTAHRTTRDRVLVQAGTLLEAQGGFLILDFEEVASEPDVWRHLKRCLRYDRLEIPAREPAFGAGMGLLKPEPIPLVARLVAWGDEKLYQEFYERDPGFAELFTIRADLDTQMDRGVENIQGYLAFLRQSCESEGLLPFLPTGAASFIDAGAELAGKQKKLTTRWTVLTDLLREASYLAEQEGSPSVADRHVEKAQEDRRYRSNLTEEQLDDMIRDNSVLIRTDGAKVGQVNGIALYETEDYLFGRPCRITAQTGMGRSGVVNIEREVNLSGKIHDKGVLILCGFLRTRFAQDKPLTLGASLCIEQFYSEIDGDSASLGEICALLSSLAEVPIRQGIAVTGAISQHGDVQAVGCVSEKVLGFFDICLHRGLTGDQGVVIPAGNVDDLMLPAKIVRAAEKGDFSIYAVRTVDQALEILTGREAGQPDSKGQFPQGSVNGRVDERLWELATGLRDFLGEEEEPDDGDPSID
jgi:predicted ATP-dependent protease